MEDKITLKRVVLDTNVLMGNLDYVKNAFKDYQFVLTTITLEELDHLKFSPSQEKSYKARSAIRFVDEYEDEFEYMINDQFQHLQGWEKKNDNLILDTCMVLKESSPTSCGIATYDKAVKIKANSLGIEVVCLDNCIIDKYTGWKIVEMSDPELAYWYEMEVKVNNWDLLIGQYLIIKNKGELVDVWKWSDRGFVIVGNKKINSKMLGNYRPKDIYQKSLLDSLHENKITLIKGKPGSGKSLAAISYALSQIEKGKYSQLIVFTNPLPSLNSAKLGFYPGTRLEKLSESSTGGILCSKLGGMDSLMRLYNDGVLDIIPMCDIRGYDTTGMNAIIWVQEAQNADINLMKTCLQRIGDDSKCIIDGDFEAQVDLLAFANGNNGMRRASEVFRGHSCYGEIELPIIYRGEIAEIADLM